MYQAFSDGGCKGNPGPGGWGCVVETPDQGVLEGYGNKALTTNNQMELTGAIEALRLTPVRVSVTLTTDSQYVIKGITEWMSGWKRRDWQASTGGEVKNKELWMLLDIEAQQRTVSWQWVRGHTGHPQNERCDELGNIAIAELTMDTEVKRKVKRARSSSSAKAKVIVTNKGPDPALGIEALFEL